MKQRFYLDTSVFGGVFDWEFEEWTLQLFERIKLGKVMCLYSELIETEFLDAPDRVKKFFMKLPKENMEKVQINDDILRLATKYIDEKVVGQTALMTVSILLRQHFTKRTF